MKILIKILYFIIGIILIFIPIIGAYIYGDKDIIMLANIIYGVWIVALTFTLGVFMLIKCFND